ncbi:hypothetical protein BJ170DRAFT_598673 [Xylariales sp. AK1849]|nr:hypothetical protein BJ170DRAFT_598673 [Xylariales sp. AK1849]
MCEDMDEQDNVVEGSYKYARSNIASTPNSPVKQAMNTGRKKSSKRADSISPHGYSLHDSDSTAQPSSSRRKDKRLSSTKKVKDVIVDSPKRPSVRTAKTTPASTRLSEEASYYGITQQQTVASSRPRAHTTRPQSYYGQSGRPPISHSAYYNQGSPAPPMNPTSYPPPPQWMGPPPGSSPMGGPSPIDYFSRPPDTLASRFARPGPELRPRSAMGFRAASYEHDEYEVPPEKALARRPSTSKRSKEQEDRKRMPPPARPQTVQPPRVMFRAPPPKKSVVFDDDDLDGESDLYEPVSNRRSLDFGAKAIPIRSRRPSISTHHDYDQYSLQPASKGRRTSSYGFEDKIKNASQYQEDVNGGPGAILTAENLRHVKNGGSSRSTRSSQSRDESSYRQSATTRTTRSGSGDDDITIKVPSGAVVEVGNAKINCMKGGEINIGRSGAGSDRSTVFGDDLKSRVHRIERPPTRTRTSSHSGSYSQSPFDPPSYPLPYAQTHHPGYAPPYPYPYPRTDYDGYDEF